VKLPDRGICGLAFREKFTYFFEMTGSHLLVFGKCASCRTGVVVFFLNVLSAPFLGRCFCSGPFFLPGSFGQGRACRWKTSPVWRICADFTCSLWKVFYPGSLSRQHFSIIDLRSFTRKCTMRCCILPGQSV
jgi:hypothetical protein